MLVDTHWVPAGHAIIAHRSRGPLPAAGDPAVAHETVASAEATASARAHDFATLTLEDSLLNGIIG